MGLVDSAYKFIMVDIGACGSEGDSNTFHNSAFGTEFMEDRIPFPEPKNLPGTKIHAPYATIGDKAFPRMIHLLKPYLKRSKQATKKARAIYNYRLSRAHMCVKCAFSILLSRFRFLLQRMMLSPAMATLCIQAEQFFVEGYWPFCSRDGSKSAACIERSLCIEYFRTVWCSQNTWVPFRHGSQSCAQHIYCILHIMWRACSVASPVCMGRRLRPAWIRRTSKFCFEHFFTKLNTNSITKGTGCVNRNALLVTYNSVNCSMCEYSPLPSPSICDVGTQLQPNCVWSPWAVGTDGVETGLGGQNDPRWG